jgi:hypothetical protein
MNVVVVATDAKGNILADFRTKAEASAATLADDIVVMPGHARNSSRGVVPPLLSEQKVLVESGHLIPRFFPYSMRLIRSYWPLRRPH